MGKAIRGDDQTRGLTVHHNLVWACDEGIIVKGDDNLVYNNTVIGTGGHGSLIIPTREEPKKWWTPHEILPIQNLHSRFFNNYSGSIAYRHKPLPQNEGISHNLTVADGGPFEQSLVDVRPEAMATDEFDPRPRAGSKLIDAGIAVEGITDDFAKGTPDVGAYQHDRPVWQPGPSWRAPADIVFEIEAEVARSHALSQPAARQSITLPSKLRQADLSDAALRKLQLLYDKCWTDDELARRREAIRNRVKHPEESPEYQAQHARVVELHQAATKRLVEKAPTILSESELKIFQSVMPTGR